MTDIITEALTTAIDDLMDRVEKIVSTTYEYLALNGPATAQHILDGNPHVDFDMNAENLEILLKEAAGADGSQIGFMDMSGAAIFFNEA